MEKHVVTISRAWGRDTPILISVTNLGIGLEVPLDEFVKAVAQEAGNPALLLTRAQLEARLEAAVRKVCETVKQATAGQV
jgi:hypothetical protein